MNLVSRFPLPPPSIAQREASSPCTLVPCLAAPMMAIRLSTLIPAMEQSIGNQISRLLGKMPVIEAILPPQRISSGYFTAGQKRRVTPAIKRQMIRRSAVALVIDHIKNEHRMERNTLKGQQGDAINAILAAAGYNFSLRLLWLKNFFAVLVRRHLLKSNCQCVIGKCHCSRSTNYVIKISYRCLFISKYKKIMILSLDSC